MDARQCDWQEELMKVTGFQPEHLQMGRMNSSIGFPQKELCQESQSF